MRQCLFCPINIALQLFRINCPWSRTVIISNQQYPIPVHHCCTISRISAASGLFTAWHIPFLFSISRDYLYTLARNLYFPGSFVISDITPSRLHIITFFHCCGSWRTTAIFSYRRGICHKYVIRNKSTNGKCCLGVIRGSFIILLNFFSFWFRNILNNQKMAV